MTKKETHAAKKSKTLGKRKEGTEKAKKDSVREAYDRLKPKWASGRRRNFKRWAIQYRESLRKRGKASA